MKPKNYFLLLITIIIAGSSCKKQLDLHDGDSFTSVNAFITLDDVQQGANDAYGRYSAITNDMYVSALLSDEAKLGPDNSGQGTFTYRYQFGSNNTSGGDVVEAWSEYPGIIDQVNRVLPYIPTVTAKPDQEYRRDILKGQLLALRGIAYFELLEAYSNIYSASDPLGVPISLVSDPLQKPARKSMGEVMTQINTDLSDARALLPAVTPADFSDTVMNQINIAAYQARIALYRKDYDAAITAATEVINSGVKPLVTGSDFAGIWTDDNNYEVLFRRRYASSGDGAIGTLFTTTAGNVYVAPSDKLIAMYDVADIRKDTYIGVNGSGNNYVNKFFSSSKGGCVVDIKACRIAEMYLIRAEAYARSSSPNLVAGAADLNLLRTNRITGYVDETFGTATDLANAVMDERFKELAFEGFRFFDLKRNSLPVERLASDASAAWQTLPAGNFRFVLPIPSDEILANPNIQQNPGY